MAQHSNYAKDRDLMMEAYGSVQGIIPHTQSTAPARMFNESGCASHSDEEKITEIELDGDLYEVGGPDPSNESELIISIEKHSNGYMITTGSGAEAGGYALSLDGKLMKEDDLEDGLGHVEEEEHEAVYTVIENDKEGSIQVEPFKKEPAGDLIKIVEKGGIVKKCYQHPEGREWVVKSDSEIDFKQEGSWTWDEDATAAEDAENEAAFDAQKEKVKAMFDQQILDEVNTKVEKRAGEPGFDHDTEWLAALKSIHSHYKRYEGKDRFAAAERLLAKSDATLAKNVGVEDNEGEAGFNGKQLEELEDIVHAILDKRDSEDRAEEHYR